MTTDKGYDQSAVRLAAGRTLNEEIEYIRKYGNHGVAPDLRNALVAALGIPKPRETAEHLIIFGCYLPFMMPLLLLDYINILEHLGVEYTYLKREFCCGATLLGTSGADEEKAMAAGKEFMQINRDLALQKGAKTISYFCIGCAYMARAFFSDDDTIRHLYYPDLIIDNLGDRKLRITPAVMGYYEGCHRRRRDLLPPDTDLNWEGYRELLERIEGLELVDLPNEICCVDYPERIVKAAEKQNLDTILCSCTRCYLTVGRTARERVQMKYLPEILLQALRGE